MVNYSQHPNLNCLRVSSPHPVFLSIFPQRSCVNIVQLADPYASRSLKLLNEIHTHLQYTTLVRRKIPVLMICCPVQAPPRSSRNRCENEEISITASITTNSYTHTCALFPVMRLESHCLVTTYIFLQNRNGSIKRLETENEKGELCQPKKQNSPVKCEIEREKES